MQGIRILAAALLLLAGCAEDARPPPKLNLDRDAITVSGISSGGYMAHQFHIAYSDQVTAAALFASGPFGCAWGNLNTALAFCMDSRTPPKVEPLLTAIDGLAVGKSIAAVTNLERDKAWIFHGSEDHTVSREVAQSLVTLYQRLGVDVETVFDMAAGHGLPTRDFGVACPQSKTPFLINCGYDAVGEFFRYFFGDLEPPRQAAGELRAFEQEDFLSEGMANTLGDTGYVYVPTTCAAGQPCRLHIAFHGCLQNTENIDRVFIENAGYNGWAEANNIVVLYPQTRSSYLPLNPKACWDWWGYTGPDYQTRQGAQLKHVHSMAEQL